MARSGRICAKSLGLSLSISRARGGISILVCTSTFSFLTEDFDLVEPIGMERMKEALEANDWESNELGDALGPEDFEDDEAESGMGFGAEAAELNMEMFGVNQAILDIGEEDEVVDQDEEVEKLQAMMQKMQAVRGEFLPWIRDVLTIGDMGADMPEAERKRFAAKAVNDIMKTL